MSKRRLSAIATVASGALFAPLLAHPAWADEIFLKNGDHITGKVVSATGGAIVIDPDFAKGSNITIPQAQISTFTTAEPLVVKFKDGTTASKTVQQGPPGQVVVASSGQAAGQTVALADIDQINPPKVAWHGTVGVNGLYSHSTTTSEEVGFTFDGVRRADKNRITVDLAYSYGRQSVDGVSTTNTNNGSAMAKYDAFFSPKWYGYADVTAARDEVNFLKLRVTPGLGGGHQWVDRGDFHFNTEGGLSWVYEDYSTKAHTTDELALRLAYHVDRAWQAGRFSVFHDMEFIPSVQSTREFLLNTDAGIKVALTKAMYSSLTGKLTYDNDPAPGSEKTTTEVRVGVGLTY